MITWLREPGDALPSTALALPPGSDAPGTSPGDGTGLSEVPGG